VPEAAVNAGLDASSPEREVMAGPAKVERVAVDHDSPAFVVRADPEAAPRLAFLPGVCSNAYAYLLSFPEAARAHGGVVAIDGDRPCVGAPGFRSFSWDAKVQDARISRALQAASPGSLSGSSSGPVTLVGYSAGAGIGEQMAERWPERYRRLVLIGAPSDPSVRRLAQAEAVVTMSCARDVPGRMKSAAQRLRAAGVPATYIEMPGCTHGMLGEAEARLGEAFRWLEANARKVPPPPR
jgi:pimeloyl-ACP methyl ester carboxylesterase